MAGLEIREGFDRMDFDLVHSWLASSYWTPGIERHIVERAARNSSLLVGAFIDGRQVGYLRIISDKTSFGWVADVFVDESARGKGVAKQMVRYAQSHPEHQGFRRWVLATRDAQGVYEACGFKLVPNPENWMIYLPDDQHPSSRDW